MGEVTSAPGVSSSAFQVLADAYAAFTDAVDVRINAILDKISASAFVSTAPMTTAALLADYPASAATVGKYARVTDLYGSVDEVMRCRYDGVAYRWVPQRDNYNVAMSAQGGGVPLVPLVTAPTVRITSSALTSNMTITPSTANAYVGQEYEIVMPTVINLGLFTTQISGLLGSNLTLLAGQVRRIQYSPTGWFQAS